MTISTVRLPMWTTCLALAFLLGADWTQFRGPGGSGVGEDKDLPTTWSEEENLAWKIDLPGPGTSSPIVAGDNVFVTCYTGYGQDRGNTGEQADLKRVLLCVNLADGAVKWSRNVDPVLPEENYRSFITEHGYASSTPATDGERVYVFFGRTGVLAFDLEGNQLWQTSVGTGDTFNNWGSASSPLLYKNLVIVNAGNEGKAVVALDKKTGKEVWKADAEALYGSWSTPIVVKDAAGNDEIALTAPYEVWSLDPKDGALIWYAEAADRAPICPSLVAVGDVVYAVGSRGGGCRAIRAGGAEDVSQSHTLWKSNASSYVPSPVVVGDHLYLINDQGVVYCLDRQTGEEVYSERLRSDSGRIGVYASPIAVDGKIIIPTRRAGVFVLAARPEFEQLAHNTFASDDTDFNASPAVAGNKLLLRSNRRLYCIGK